MLPTAAIGLWATVFVRQIAAVALSAEDKVLADSEGGATLGKGSDQEPPVTLFRRSVSICSRLRPLVSGTRTWINSAAMMQITASIQKTADLPIRATSGRNAWATTKLAPQLLRAETPVPVPRALSGKISGSITQSTGPKLTANDAMYNIRPASVTQEIMPDSPENAKAAPRITSDTVIPARPTSRRGLRPTRSI